MSDTETIGVYDHKAKEYAEITRRERPDPQLLEFLEAAPVGGPLLDLGSGPGAASAVMASKGRDVIAWDPSQGMIDLAAAQPGVKAKLAGFEDLASLTPKSFAGVWANFSLLHARRSDVPRYLGDIAKALQPKGIFHIGVKLGEGEERDSLGRFYTYFTEAELRGLLSRSGLTPFKITFGEDRGLAGPIEPWIAILSRA